MNKWQAWWDKANEVIDAAPNGVENESGRLGVRRRRWSERKDKDCDW